MRLTKNQIAPFFSIQSVFGFDIDVNSLRGKRVYLAFERNAGCPVCRLRTHELLKHAEFFKSSEVVVILVYESPLEKMKEYLGEDNYPFHFVSDPQDALYNLFKVERSIFKILNGIFNGLFSKILQGNKLFKKPMKQDGHLDRIPAEFIIDQKGNIQLAHYGKFVGDHLPLGVLMRIFIP